MFANSLTREVSLKVGPTMLEVLVKHFIDRLKSDAAKRGAHLKKDDVLFDEAFTIVKGFLNAASFHTVEDLQGFSNTRTPSPPWTHVVRTFVPLSCCEDAASHLITALGGEDVARRLVGGVKWWQVRGLKGVDAQWLTAKKDWKEAKRRYKMQKEQKNASNQSSPLPLEDNGLYDKDMDYMRCILYLHGGGYYFGSVDQERYSIQRHARKINGRVFAINYRLAPQYPFPCGLHDALSAYLYLIRPPEGSEHQAVNPAHIVIAGDSAGGGLSLALLQVIRDSGLPLPAGGVLISPWCDLTHSFQSIHTNTKTDVIPDSGLSFHRPSILWPPPSEDVSSRVHASLRFRIRQALFKSDDYQQSNQESTCYETCVPASSSSEPRSDPEKITVNTESGDVMEINHQLHFYTTNSLIGHPLVSPVMGYLGGLPPLLFIAGDKEVLRDEIVFTAHKAAYPDMYPTPQCLRNLYPYLESVPADCKPTSVHLQVYDDSPHILPVLFSFSTPAKFCFRAIASFSKLVTGMIPLPITSEGDAQARPPSLSRGYSFFAGFKPSSQQDSELFQNGGASGSPQSPPQPLSPAESSSDIPSLRRTLSARFSCRSSFLRRPSSLSQFQDSSLEADENQVSSPVSESFSSVDVGGPRFSAPPIPPAERTAGDILVYKDITDYSSWECRMIRERVGTTGVVRSLEPQYELSAFQIPLEQVGVISEKIIQRYLKNRGIFDRKFANSVKLIEKSRRRNLERAKKDTIKRLSVLRQSLFRDGKAAASGSKTKEVRENVLSSPGWGWAWALDEKEDPPPSSIVSRRDTDQARELAEIADQAVLHDDIHTFSANNLWSVVINFLTTTPDRQTPLHPAAQTSSDKLDNDAVKQELEGNKSKLSRIHLWNRGHAKHHHNSP